MIPCAWKYYFGIECPGCGMQRSFLALIHGDFYESLLLFPALIPVLLTFVFLFLHLRFKFRHGANIVMVLFLSSTAIMLTNYVMKISTHGFHV